MTDRVETLTKLWSDGYSATLCAMQLGSVTRNAVIGKVFRLKLPSRSIVKALAHGAMPREMRFPRRKRYEPPRFRPERAPAPMFLPPLNLLLIELTPTMCRWAVNEGGPYRFCANETERGHAYCEAHERMSVGMGTASERRAHVDVERTAA